MLATGPLRRVREDGVGVMLDVSIKKLIVACAAFLERGIYPIFLASATTFSLRVALSMKTSFATIFALYDVI